MCGLRTGYTDLDNMLTGLKPGELFVIAARANVDICGFTRSLVSSIAAGVEPKPVGVFSLEMGAGLFVLALICSDAGVSLRDVRDGATSNNSWNRIMTAAVKFKDAPIYIEDIVSDVHVICSRAREMKAQHNIQALFIDTFQFILPSPVETDKTVGEENDLITGHIKALAKELNIPIVLATWMDCALERSGTRPMFSNQRELGLIARHADIFAVLQPDDSAETGELTVGSHGGTNENLKLVIPWHRNGPTGVVKFSVNESGGVSSR